MSLLLEALKKAERAKEEAQRRARGETAPRINDATAAEPGERKAVLTREHLPDISPSLEIVSDEPPSAERAPLELAPELAGAKESARPRPSVSAAAEAAASRASAKKVFEAKFRESNPRMPFYITMGTLGVFALGAVVYFWYQLRPAPSLANSNPQPQPAAVASAPAPAAPVAPSLGSAGGIAGLPAAAKSTPVAASADTPVRAATPPAAETPRFRAEPRREEPRLPTASVARAPAQVHPNVAAGYAAYVAGDFASARNEYQQALAEEPGNRDALLGLAALEIRGGRYESAEALYLRVLQADPRDPQAQAALIALRSGRSDALASESRVKSLLAADPGAHALNFTLGNQLASQNRWAEAQQEYFRAYTAEPDNADYAYNLAVSLDHLRQPRQALDYYRRAIILGEKHGAGFDLGAARSRAAQLGR